MAVFVEVLCGAAFGEKKQNKNSEIPQVKDPVSMAKVQGQKPWIFQINVGLQGPSRGQTKNVLK